jgi:DUF1365 family protein
MLAINLDYFPKVPFLSQNRFNLFSIDKRDHINTDPTLSIRQNLTSWLAEKGTVIPADAKILLITFPRVLGYAFNPVSFYYIYRSNGEPLTAVAEVTNTYREMKLFPLGKPIAEGKFDHTIPKNFYVSPFSDPNDTFHFRIGQPSETWTVHIDNLSAAKPQPPIRHTRRATRTHRFPSRMVCPSIPTHLPLHHLPNPPPRSPTFPKKNPPLPEINARGGGLHPPSQNFRSTIILKFHNHN